MNTKIISISGPDGSGKTTAVNILSEISNGKAISASSFASPAGILLGAMLDEIELAIVAKPGYKLRGSDGWRRLRFRPDVFEALQYTNLLEMQEYIKQATASNRYIFLDRYVADFEIYSRAFNLSEEWIAGCVNTLIKPDLTIVLDSSKPKVIDDVIESNQDFMTSVRNGFLAKSNDWKIINTDNLSIFDTIMEIVKYLNNSGCSIRWDEKIAEEFNG